jgi:hypothetical protein
MAVRIGQKFLKSSLLSKSFLPSVQKCSSSAAPGGGSYSNEKTTHFGYKTVTEEEKKKKGEHRIDSLYYSLHRRYGQTS